VNKWSPRADRPHWLDEIATSGQTKGTVLVWEHGLSDERGFSLHMLEASAVELLDAIVTKWAPRERQPRPILFVCHSFGGIIVKQVTVAVLLALQGLTAFATADNAQREA
jgi:predicted alpha/beta hydrolase family esterase